MSERRKRLFNLRNFRSRERERELDEEIHAHLAMHSDDLVAAGWTREEADKEAVRRFGPPEVVRAELLRSARVRDRRLRMTEVLDGFRADARLAFRRMRRAPGFTALSVAIFALGIGFTTAVFAAVDQVLLQPPGFPDPHELVVLKSVDERGSAFPQVSSENWLDWSAENETLHASAIFHNYDRPIVDLDEGPVRVALTRVSPAFFDVLRPAVVAGRRFTAGEPEGSAMVSEGFWRSKMGAAPLPATLSIDGTLATVLGVLGDRHTYPANTEVWLLTEIRALGFGGARNLINWESVARVAPGVTRERVRADLDRIAHQIRERAPEARYSWGVGVAPLHAEVVSGARDGLMLLLGSVGALLLLACLNLAGLSSARTLGRTGELAVRAALGATRSRIVRQLLTEHLLLSVAGGVGGVAVAWLGVEALRSRASVLLPPGATLRLEPETVAFAFLLATLSGLVAGALPAFHALGGRGRRALRDRSGVGTSQRAVRGLVVAQVGLALALLVGGGLLFRSLRALVARDLGFEPQGVVVTRVSLDRPGYSLVDGDPQGGAARRRAYWLQVIDAVRAAPGVRSAGMMTALPTVDGGRGFIDVEGSPDEDAGAAYRVVLGEPFEALGVPVLRGRAFNGLDGPDTERVTVINRAMSERYWPDQSPIGQRVRARSMEGVNGPAPWLTVVGVVGNVRNYAYDETPTAEMYTLATQVPFWMAAGNVVAQVEGALSAATVDGIERAVQRVDPSIPLETSLLSERLQDWVAARMFLAGLLGMFSGIALILSGLGLYSLLAFAVTRRTREIGIRAALGAGRSTIVAEVVRQGLRLTVLGLGVGLLVALAVGRIVANQLVDIPATDFVSFSFGAGTLLAAALCASIAPAWRAARVDPVTALRAETSME